jgi:hypothetical protein
MGDDYAFEFKCGNKVSGEAYTNFATPTEGMLTLECDKPAQTPVSVENCKIIE